MAEPFQFKEFNVFQDRCAMKVGTDGVLLGAWTPIDHDPQTILDIGSGTGLIALQLAQRCSADTIDAIEIDENAYEQCVENFENSPWDDRLYCYHAAMQEFASEMDEQYDLIVSNPPFYSEDYKTPEEARNKARFTDALPFDHLVICTAHLLAENGSFCVIIPKKEESGFIELASKVELYPKRICHVRGTANSEVKRSLIEFTFENGPVETTELTIEIERHQYTQEYIDLTKAFYRDM